MASNAIFRQLTCGVHFNTKAFPNQAKQLGLIKNIKEEEQKENTSKEKLPSLEDITQQIKLHNFRKRRRSETGLDSNSEDEDTIHLVGDIKATTTENMKAKKKKKRKEKHKFDSEEKEKNKILALYEEKINQFRNRHNIHTIGSDIPLPVDDWAQLTQRYQVSSKLLANVINKFPSPTPVQMQAIPLMLESRELLACAPTGSGKTAAFLIPVLHALKEPRNVGYRAVVVVPTKELALQIEQECQRLCESLGIRAHCLGKVKTDKIIQGSLPKYDILITPPNRLVYMINHDPPLINLKKVEWLIIDEADKLFEDGVKGFRDQLAIIYKACSGPNIRRGMFSATMGQEVHSWCKLNLDNMVSLRIGALNSATETIKQELLYCGSEHGKLVAFRSLLQKGLEPPVLIFVQTKERAQELFKELLYDGIHVDVIHSERSELQRENTVRAFRSGGIWVLICTELMGRGIDFKGVNLVINYDFPPSAVSYIHRIGRTGRAGRTGHAITYFTESDRPLLKTIAQVMRNSGCEVPDYMLQLKASRDKKKQLKTTAVKRAKIATESKYDAEKRKKREEMIKASKKRKQQNGENVGKSNSAQSVQHNNKDGASEWTVVKNKKLKKKKAEKMKNFGGKSADTRKNNLVVKTKKKKKSKE